MSDSEQCSNRLELYWISPFGQLFMWIQANNDQIWLPMGCQWTDITSYGLNEWFWEMFELTWTWPYFTFGQLFMWIRANNDHILLYMG